MKLKSKQRLIFDKLHLLIGPGPAAFYKDTCQLMRISDQLESRSHLIAHLLREIESALRDVLKPIDWNAKKDKKKNKKDTNKKEVEAILKVFDFPDKDRIKERWFEFINTKERKTHRDSLESPRIVDSEFVEWYSDFEDLLYDLLNGFQTKFSVVFQKIDALLEDSCINAKQLKKTIPNNLRILTYFFDNCENPAWLLPLKENGFFSFPPPPKQNEMDGSIEFMLWPQSRFLLKMASFKPELVMEIILQVPDNGNIRVYEYLVDAALNMPPKISIRLLTKAKGWLEGRIPDMLLTTKLGDLLIHYARGQQSSAAFELAGKLFEIYPALDWSEEKDDGPYGSSPEPKIKYSNWDYQENIGKCIPELLKLSGLQTLEYLCALLDKAIKYSRKKNKKDEIEDYSCYWQPAIEDHAQNNPYEFKSILVNQVRDASEWLLEKGKFPISEVLKIIRKSHWRIFLRIELHLLRRFAKRAPELVEKQLLDLEMFTEHTIYHEYTLLLQECFNLLSAEKQQIILGWIEKGPDLGWFNKAFKEEKKRDPDLEEISRYRRYWQWEWLFFIEVQLSGEYKKRYEEMEREFGNHDHPGFRSYISTWWGSKSPKDTKELQQMTMEDTIEYLQNWKPTNDPKSPSPEALGNTFSAVVATSPEKYSSNAVKFEALCPIYVRSLLRGLHDALNQKSSFAWAPVLELCKWIVEQPVKIANKKILSRMEDDLDWGNTRNAIANLLSAGLEDRAGAISIEYREIVWFILVRLTGDSDPSPEYEEKYGGSNIDPSTMSINTTRGEAMHATIRYALWVRRDFDKSGDAIRTAQGLRSMPEVCQVLEEHLDYSRESTLTVRTVYGQWFPSLILLDKDWAQSHVNEIFPLDSTKIDYFFAAWDAYVIFCQVHDGVFDILKDQYGFAIENLGISRTDKRIANPDERLAQHLMVLYWGGKIEIGEPDGLLRRYWKKASPQLRGQALSFIGRSLQHTSDDIPTKLLDRLKMLWQCRLDEAKNTNNTETYKEEIKAFSWWFLSGKFSDEWAIANLYEVLKITGEIEMNHLVMEKLNKLVKTKTSEVVECLDLIVLGDRLRWTVLGISDYIRTILSEALKTQSALKAEEIVNNLLSQGHIGFRDLLEGRK